MDRPPDRTLHRLPGYRAGGHSASLLVLLCASLTCGCAALTQPLGDALPVRRVPEELLAPSKAGLEPLPPSCLGQPRPDAYRLAPGDVLGVYIEGFLGERTQPLPVQVGTVLPTRDQRRLPPALGYPVQVQDDGTLTLPLVEPLSVSGLTVGEARDAIRNHYVRKRLLKPESDRVLLSLVQPRLYQVLVLREEATTFEVELEGAIPSSKRGTGSELELPAYENDVLHALTRSGGLPGLDALDEVYIFRGCFHHCTDRAAFRKAIAAHAPGSLLPRGPWPGLGVVRIPLRVPAGEPLPFRPEDVRLQSGDVVVVPPREQHLFYTGGLLPPGAYVLPRDTDLDVLEAVSRVRGPLFNGAFGGSNLSGALIQAGIGNPSPTLVVVLRRTPRGGQVPIRVDLSRALRDPRERLLVQPGDVLLLQEMPGEALARYFTQTFFNFNFVWQLWRDRLTTGVIDVSTPDRIPGQRLPTLNLDPQGR